MARELLQVLHQRDIPHHDENLDAVASKCIVSQDDRVRGSIAELWGLLVRSNNDATTRRLQEVIVLMGFDPWLSFESDLDTTTPAVQQKDTTFAIDVTSYVVYSSVIVTALVITMLHVKRIRYLRMHEMSITGYTLLAVSACFAFLQIFFHTMPIQPCADEMQVLQGLSRIQHTSTTTSYDGFVKKATIVYETDVMVDKQELTARLQFVVSAQCQIKRFFAQTPRTISEVYGTLNKITRNTDVEIQVSILEWSDEKNALLSRFFHAHLHDAVYHALIDLIFATPRDTLPRKSEKMLPEL
jgi:hypothetical protein